MYIDSYQKNVVLSSIQDPNWHLNFILPEKTTLGYSVSRAIETGVVTTTAKRRLVDVISRCILVHTMAPSKQQYNHVCQQLVDKFPNLRDKGLEGRGTGYVRPIALATYALCNIPRLQLNLGGGGVVTTVRACMG